MDQEPEIIREQMDDTRTALSEKLELLEKQVVETVQDATTSVAVTVETMKDAVEDTVQSVKDSVHETKEAVKETFDIKHQVRQRPWTMLMGAMAAGYIGGRILNKKSSSIAPKVVQPLIDYTGRQTYNQTPAVTKSRRDDPRAFDQSSKISADSEDSGWLGSIGNAFQAELTQVKGLALGTVMGVIRDLISESVPDSVEPQVTDVMNNLTTKLGGQPIRGRILPVAPDVPVHHANLKPDEIDGSPWEVDEDATFSQSLSRNREHATS